MFGNKKKYIGVYPSFFIWYFNSRSEMCDKKTFFALYCFDFFHLFFEKSIASRPYQRILIIMTLPACGRDKTFFLSMLKMKKVIYFFSAADRAHFRSYIRFGRVGAEVKSTLQKVSGPKMTRWIFYLSRFFLLQNLSCKSWTNRNKMKIFLY